MAVGLRGDGKPTPYFTRAPLHMNQDVGEETENHPRDDHSLYLAVRLHGCLDPLKLPVGIHLPKDMRLGVDSCLLPVNTPMPLLTRIVLPVCSYIHVVSELLHVGILVLGVQDLLDIFGGCPLGTESEIWVCQHFLGKLVATGQTAGSHTQEDQAPSRSDRWKVIQFGKTAVRQVATETDRYTHAANCI